MIVLQSLSLNYEYYSHTDIRIKTFVYPHIGVPAILFSPHPIFSNIYVIHTLYAI